MATFHYRRSLTRAEEARALGAGIGAALGVGAVAFYLARVMMQRTPLPSPGAGSGPAIAGPRAGRPLAPGAGAPAGGA